MDWSEAPLLNLVVSVRRRRCAHHGKSELIPEAVSLWQSLQSAKCPDKKRNSWRRRAHEGAASPGAVGRMKGHFRQNVQVHTANVVTAASKLERRGRIILARLCPPVLRGNENSISTVVGERDLLLAIYLSTRGSPSADSLRCAARSGGRG